MTSLAKSEATIARILDAARSLFLSRSYAEVTTARIARSAGVTKGALYHHFSSKEELYLGMLHADLREKEELFQRAVEAGGTARERLGRLTRAFLELPGPARDVIKLIRRDVNIFADPERGELVRAYQRALPELVEQIVSEGIGTGELATADARLLSWHYVALVEVSLSAHADRLHESVDDKLRQVLDLFFHGAAPRPGDSES